MRHEGLNNCGAGAYSLRNFPFASKIGRPQRRGSLRGQGPLKDNRMDVGQGSAMNCVSESRPSKSLLAICVPLGSGGRPGRHRIAGPGRRPCQFLMRWDSSPRCILRMPEPSGSTCLRPGAGSTPSNSPRRCSVPFLTAIGVPIRKFLSAARALSSSE